MTRFLRWFSAVVLSGVLVALGASPASAHASLIETDPADGAVLDTAPTTLTFTFNEVVGEAAAAVTAPDGSNLELGEPRAVDNTVTVEVPDVNERGTYVASYRVVSADGHPIAGTIRYEVTTGEVVESSPTADAASSAASETFIERHRSHIFWGILAAVVAVVLLFEPWRRRNDADDT